MKFSQIGILAFCLATMGFSIGCSTPGRSLPLMQVTSVNNGSVSPDVTADLEGFMRDHRTGWNRAGAVTPSNYIRVDGQGKPFSLGYRGSELIRQNEGATYVKVVAPSEVARLRGVISRASGGGYSVPPPPPTVTVPTPETAPASVVVAENTRPAKPVAQEPKKTLPVPAPPEPEPNRPDPEPTRPDPEEFVIPEAPKVEHPEGIPELKEELAYLKTIWPANSTVVSSKTGFDGKGGFVYTGVIGPAVLDDIEDKYEAKFGVRPRVRKFGW